ncbi:MAPEG family protein [Roseibium sp. FZY0029]|uniref:MAPEG family protein n=1 Tax=Roseibium sp. FZY0029 TaxID=3116647 RepID=UPI002E9A7313|nr:MAPEG family protein [Roseibium sp. FZY0029]
MPLTTKQHGVLKGMIAAVIVAATGLGLGAFQYPQDWLTDGSPQARFTLAAQCLLASAFWLLLSIGILARHRFFTPEDIDGSGLTSGTAKARVLQAMLQNTLEQTALAALTYLAFAALTPAEYLGALPAAALLFWCGRALFWQGYAQGAAARSFGFALTFYSTVLLFVAALFFSFV